MMSGIVKEKVSEIEKYTNNPLTSIGVGISIHKPQDLRKIETVRNNLMGNLSKPHMVKPIAQTVVGVTPYNTMLSTFWEAVDKDVPMLFLGYKPVGRGAVFEPTMQSKSEIKELLQQALDVMRDEDRYLQRFHVSVDTAFLDQYGDVLDELEIPTKLRSSPEGAFSMYIDAVEDTVGPSSYCDKSEMMQRGNIVEQFATFIPDPVNKSIVSM